MNLAEILAPAPPDNVEDRHSQLLALLKDGHLDLAHAAWRAELATGERSFQWAQFELERAMERGDFSLMEQLGKLLAYRWRSPWYPQQTQTDEAELLPRAPRDSLTVSKLRHDAGQFAYLRSLELLPPQFDTTIQTYHDLADRLHEEDRKVLSGVERSLIGNVYNRIVHLPEVGRVERALSPNWSPREIEERFLDRGEGLVIIDDFLTPLALEGLHRFAMQATVWTGIRYAFGRFGAFFQDGFNCALLLQVAEELKAALPRVITPRYPLRQIWGFKNADDLPRDVNLHADFAAVDVNFWLTPDACNLDPASGGMKIYDVDAPQAWDFHTYNGRTDIIKAFLRENHAQETYVPYRQNRCVMFNSDLFHGTHEVHFKPGFENHRINVTMLYGHRENDELHRTLSSRPDLQSRWGRQASAWRSHVFSRHRT
ncbi:hypothetical protein GJ698_06070 [Pseudoduganella sp. FT26W]|uniref:Uncharacterized protein n=1 Tax=Duganella aquatilis TaxID=2666082 RepID=A0A844D8T4_9BURK|nr:hypothetical protein [Duganella aquatilis]MRW83659.1 hypothetical protein [Duganella aquatilis]